MNAEWNCRVRLLASKMVKKTVIILAANVLMRASSGRMLVVDLNTSKGGPPKSAAAGGSTGVASFSKTAWTCSVEAVCEYSRMVFDLFPHQCQVWPRGMHSPLKCFERSFPTSCGPTCRCVWWCATQFGATQSTHGATRTRI